MECPDATAASAGMAKAYFILKSRQKGDWRRRWLSGADECDISDPHSIYILLSTSGQEEARTPRYECLENEDKDVLILANFIWSSVQVANGKRR